MKSITGIFCCLLLAGCSVGADASLLAFLEPGRSLETRSHNSLAAEYHWQTLDIGTTNFPGSVTESEGTYELVAAGNDVYYYEDDFYFVHLPLKGDGSITARVNSVENVHPWAKGGIMMRESLDADSRHVSIFAAGDNPVAFQRRALVAGWTRYSLEGSGPPVWLRLVRAGDLISAFRSDDGVTWTPANSYSLPSLGETVYVGLGASSHDPAQTVRVSMDNVSLDGDVPRRPRSSFVATHDLLAGFKWGYHFEGRAENYLEAGWRTGQKIQEMGYMGEDSGKTLKIFLLAGQSNMEGHAVTFEAQALGGDATSLEFLLNDAVYRGSLDPLVYTLLTGLNANWLTPRNDVFGMHVDSGNANNLSIINSLNGPWSPGPVALQPGFGSVGGNVSRVGMELGLAHNLGQAYNSPIFLFKADHGGTSLRTNWRSPSAVLKRGGQVGNNYQGMATALQDFLSNLNPADYGATDYEIVGFVWLQGWNDRGDSNGEYKFNMLDLIHDVRTLVGVPHLPGILVEHPQGGRSVEPDGRLSGADGVISQAKLDALEILDGPGNGSPSIDSLTVDSSPVDFPAATTARAQISDPDGDLLSHEWQFVSGPGLVSFGDAGALNTTVSFSYPGAYVIGLRISDGKDMILKTITIQVNGSTAGFFEWREAVGGSTSVLGHGSGAPVWLKLERVGNLFSAFRSTDGVNWSATNSKTISMGTNIYLGLAASPNDASKVCRAVFDSVTLSS